MPSMRSRTSNQTARALKELARKQRLTRRAELISAGLEFPSKKTGKFHNVWVTYGGQRYQSLGEAEYAAKLELRRLAGQILKWERAESFILVDAPKVRDRITYKPDFKVWPIPINNIDNKLDNEPYCADHPAKVHNALTRFPEPCAYSVERCNFRRKFRHRRILLRKMLAYLINFPIHGYAHRINDGLLQPLLRRELADGIRYILEPSRIILLVLYLPIQNILQSFAYF